MNLIRALGGPLVTAAVLAAEILYLRLNPVLVVLAFAGYAVLRHFLVLTLRAIYPLEAFRCLRPAVDRVTRRPDEADLLIQWGEKKGSGRPVGALGSLFTVIVPAVFLVVMVLASSDPIHAQPVHLLPGALLGTTYLIGALAARSLFFDPAMESERLYAYLSSPASLVLFLSLFSSIPVGAYLAKAGVPEREVMAWGAFASVTLWDMLFSWIAQRRRARRAAKDR